MTKKCSRIKFLVHNHTLFKTIRRRFRKFKAVEPADKINEQAKYVFNYKFDCKNPRTFNEWLCWLKLNYRNDLWKKCADKLGSKEFIKSIGLEKYLPKVYGVWNSSKDIDLSLLPDKFVLKTNHDCGSVYICEKGKTDFNLVFQKLDESLKKKYSSNNMEWVYDDIKPCIFAEEVLYPKFGSELVDYKFFMFGGKIAFGFTGQNRTIDTRFTLYDKEFKNIPSEYIYLNPDKKSWPKKPDCWEEMVSICESISSKFNFVRVDLYWTTDGPKVGELTFFSQSGMGPFTNKKYDFEFGKYFKDLDFRK